MLVEDSSHTCSGFGLCSVALSLILTRPPGGWYESPVEAAARPTPRGVTDSGGEASGCPAGSCHGCFHTTHLATCAGCRSRPIDAENLGCRNQSTTRCQHIIDENTLWRNSTMRTESRRSS